MILDLFCKKYFFSDGWAVGMALWVLFCKNWFFSRRMGLRKGWMMLDCSAWWVNL